MASEGNGVNAGMLAATIGSFKKLGAPNMDPKQWDPSYKDPSK